MYIIIHNTCIKFHGLIFCVLTDKKFVGIYFRGCGLQVPHGWTYFMQGIIDW